MAGFVGVLVSDPWLQSQFTQVQLRDLKFRFIHMKTDTGTVRVADLASGMAKLKAFQELLTEKEVKAILDEYYTDKEKEIDFESFLRMYLNLQSRASSKMGGSRTSSSFLNAATTTLLHTISESEKKAYVAHINSCFEEDPIMKRYLPIDPSTNDLFEIAKDGVLLWYTFLATKVVF